MAKVKNRHHRMIYDGIELVRADSLRELWHLPGREVVTRRELVRRAEYHGVTLLEQDGLFGNQTALTAIT